MTSVEELEKRPDLIHLAVAMAACLPQMIQAPQLFSGLDKQV